MNYELHLDMIQTAGIGALALIVGMILTRKVAFLQKFCVPSPTGIKIGLAFQRALCDDYQDVM